MAIPPILQIHTIHIYSYVVETSVVGNIQQLFRTIVRPAPARLRLQHPKSPTESLGSTLSWDLPSPMAALLACPQSIWPATVSTCSFFHFGLRKSAQNFK